jgi:sporulation protein YlmC with PRC-barrel domain
MIPGRFPDINSVKQVQNERLNMKKCRKFNSILAAASLCVVSAGSTVVMAQELSTDKPTPQQTSDTATPPSQTQVASKCSQLIGTTVRNEKGQKLGKIADVVVTFDNQRVSYCVMSMKSGMFTRTRYVAVPLAAFQPNEDGSQLILHANRANLAKAGGFDRNEWPSAITSAWGAEPAAPEELPPVEVFAPPVESAPEAGYPFTADPAMGPPPARQSQSISEAIDAFHFQLAFGYVVSGH